MQCANCGHTLVKEGARFCNNCGEPLPSNATIAQVAGEVKGTALAEKPVPTGMKDTPLPLFPELSAMTTNPGLLEPPLATPMPLEVEPESEAEKGAIADQQTRPMNKAEDEKGAIADQPTRPMDKTEAEKGTIADQLTTPLETPTAPKPAPPIPPTPQGIVQKGAGVLNPYLARCSAFYESSILPRLPVPLRNSKQPWLVVLALILIPILVLGSLAISLIGHPLGVAADTQPWLSSSEADLGLTLQYPNGWQQQIGQNNRSIHFYDSSQTGQVHIQVTDATSTALPQYLQQQAKTLALSNVKTTAPLSFAGTSWQGVQGNVVLNGANYNETLMATLHNNHTYLIAMLAPTSIYDREDQLIFSHMRATLQFV